MVVRLSCFGCVVAQSIMAGASAALECSSFGGREARREGQSPSEDPLPSCRSHLAKAPPCPIMPQTDDKIFNTRSLLQNQTTVMKDLKAKSKKEERRRNPHDLQNQEDGMLISGIITLKYGSSPQLHLVSIQALGVPMPPGSKLLSVLSEPGPRRGDDSAQECPGWPGQACRST